MKRFLRIALYILFSFVIIFYLGIVLFLPKIVNNTSTINKLEKQIFNKTGIETNITGINLKVSPILLFALNIESIDTNFDNTSVIDIKNLSLNYRLFQNRLIFINAEKIYIDGNNLKKIVKTSQNKKKKEFKIPKVPEINIKNITFKSDDVDIFGQNIEAKNGIIKLKTDIKTPYLNKTVKIGNSGNIQVLDNKISANQFKIELGNSQIFINGTLFDKDKSIDCDINGKKLPVSELMPILLHFQKSQDPTKKFIENFKNYNGSIDLDLRLNNNGIFGKGVAKNLSANAVWFDIPLYFKEAVFNFNGDSITSVAQGILGNEKVIHTLKITNLGTDEKKVVGTMDTTLTKNFKFVPNLTILNSAKANLIYKIKYKKIDVFYDLELAPNSDLIYNKSYLGLRDNKRKIYAHTYKDGNDLQIKEYKYTYSNSAKENIVVSGDGLFVKVNDKFTPRYITCHTNGYAPISVTGSFGEKVNGGEFKGDLKYDYLKNRITGTFDIINARHKEFKIDQAHVHSENDIVNVLVKGLYKGEKYSAEMSAQNNFLGRTLIYNMKLFLDKLVIETQPETPKQDVKINPEDISKKVQDADITINNWEILINEIRREKFVLEKVKLIGSMKNNIFDFNMNQLNFADGVVRAKGIYNFAQNTSKMTFAAENINSNKAANMMLNLQDQIEGTANAKVDLSAKDMFKYIDAHCWFEVKEGFLPKLGDSEFAIKNSKYKLSQITNYDLAQRDEMQFDIKGAFDVHNTEVKNIDIKTYAPDSAMYLEGNYEMEKQYADLQLFWKYSKESPKGIRIFCVPLSLILKVVFRPEHSMEMYKNQFAKVPAINVSEKRTNFYRVHLNGDINNNKVNIILKEIK